MQRLRATGSKALDLYTAYPHKAMIYLFSIDSQRRITVGQASLACVRSLA
jgi:hypothetical protein